MNWVKVTSGVLTVAGWLFVIAAAAGDYVSFEAGRVAMMVALVGTLAWMVRRNSRPADEIFEAGRRLGRSEAIKELSEEGIRHLDDYRASRLGGGYVTLRRRACVHFERSERQQPNSDPLRGSR